MLKLITRSGSRWIRRITSRTGPLPWIALVLLWAVLSTVGCAASPVARWLATPALPTLAPSPGAPCSGEAGSPCTLPPADEVALAFLEAWERDDYAAMYALLSPAARERYAQDHFTRVYQTTTLEATILSVSPRILASFQSDLQSQTAGASDAPPHADVSFTTQFETASVGNFTVENQMPLSFVEGRWGVDWTPQLIFPQLSDDSQVRLTPLAPSRGNIYDRDGLGLAVQGQAVEVGVVPGQLQDEAAVLDQLSGILNEDPDAIRARYTNANPEWYVPLGELDLAEGKALYETLNANPGAPWAAGVQLREAWTRSYRSEGVAPQVIGLVGPIPREQADTWRAHGYTGDEMVGWMGLERWGEPYLAGERGGRLEIVRASGGGASANPSSATGTVAVLAEKPPQASSNLYTTFDRAFQKEVEGILGQRLGAIVVLEADTGRVLALATYPTFDPNAFAQGITQEEWDQLQNDPRHPLLNRATQGLYPPGSVFKVVTTAAALEAADLTADSTFVCEGTWSKLGPEFPKHCWLRTGHGRIDLAKALTVSCDITFYEIGLILDELDRALLPDYARRFGLGQRTGIEVEEEAGLVPSPLWKMENKGEGWAAGDTVNLAIGQSELLVSPLQMATILAAVGNGGILYRPSVLEMIASDPGEPQEVFEPMATGQLPVSPENLAVIQNSLLQATSAADGTANDAFQGFQLAVAGKTGTAESGAPMPHAWFAGYAPAQDPEIAIAVVLEYAGTGGQEAAPLFRQVVEAYAQAANLSPATGAVAMTGIGQ